MRLPERPDAAPCLHDRLVLTAVRALHADGRPVFEDLDVVGFDDIEATRFSIPALTTVAPHKRGGGRWSRCRTASTRAGRAGRRSTRRRGTGRSRGRAREAEGGRAAPAGGPPVDAGPRRWTARARRDDTSLDGPVAGPREPSGPARPAGRSRYALVHALSVSRNGVYNVVKLEPSGSAHGSW
ncbi:substrate-binding domain-containing protein [Streptomyces sp. YIM B13518]|uniref:substrate-binding domain-containing protein n=1 Tax=Streptomyces sp. YIM B13518 TaxID=3366316 RepID=UPI00368C0D2E